MLLSRNVAHWPPNATLHTSTADNFAETLSTSVSKVDALLGTNAVGYSSVAALTFLIYDIMLTFDQEVASIWPNPWNLVKGLFFFIRYFPVVLQITTLFLGTPPFTFTEHECYIWNVYQALSSTLIIAAVDYILILRIFAIYNRSKAVRTWISILYVAELITIAIGLGLAVPKFTFDEYCTILDSPPIFLVSAGTPIAFQTVLFGLTGYKFVRAVKDGWGNIAIIKLLMRDGTWAFILIFVVLVSEAMLYGLAPDAYTDVLYGWLNTTFSFCGYRVLLNLNTLARVRRSATTLSPVTSPDIVFTSNLFSTVAGHSDSSGVDGESHELADLSEAARSRMSRVGWDTDRTER